MRRTLLLLTTLILLAGCSGSYRRAEANLYPPAPPPPHPTEVVPMSPVTEVRLIWQPGHWDWSGGGYAWTSGSFVPLAGHSDQWMDGYWSKVGETWVWVPAHWV